MAVRALEGFDLVGEGEFRLFVVWLGGEQFVGGCDQRGEGLHAEGHLIFFALALGSSLGELRHELLDLLGAARGDLEELFVLDDALRFGGFIGADVRGRQRRGCCDRAGDSQEEAGDRGSTRGTCHLVISLCGA